MEEEDEEEAKTKKTTMTPREQHSAVISIPHFEYNAPSSFLRHWHSGFLISRTISRGRTAPPKKPCASLKSGSNNLEVADAKLTAKRWKACPEELDQDGADGAECGHSTNEYWNEDGKLSDDVSSQKKEDACESLSSSFISLVDRECRLSGAVGIIEFFLSERTSQT